ncbi:glycosyltransferase [Psychroserpens sp. XS_ASV72]|uniref:glycosyltransferase n=1 Tax=Psychroserpens sp. XS_ASV72 TaxID=3241293 RepID=UPI003514CCCF
MILELVFYAFIVIVSIQVVFYSTFLIGFTKSYNTNPKPKKIAISVLICAKNEAENLKLFLPSIISQAYPNFEIVLINDGSKDDTLTVMESFKEKFDHIKIVNVKPIETFWGNKKYALTLGIKAASHDFLLFTDGDCRPLSKYWISEMSAHFSNSKSIVLGYGSYKKIKGSFLNALIRFETFLTAIQYVSLAKLGNPYMAVGRNLAYRKELFFEANGFMSHMNVKSGDDDLFINQAANTSNTAICISKESFTESNPKTTFKDWVAQKRRHISTAKYYKTKDKYTLGIFYISQFLFWLLAIVLLSTVFKWKIVVALVVLRFVIQLITFFIASKKLDEKDLPFLSPIIEIVLIAFQFFIFIKNTISKPQYWK